MVSQYNNNMIKFNDNFNYLVDGGQTCGDEVVHYGSFLKIKQKYVILL